MHQPIVIGPTADAVEPGLEQLELVVAELGVEGLRSIADSAAGRAQTKASADYWLPRVSESFGVAGSQRFDTLKRFGLRHSPNQDLRAAWRSRIDALLDELKLL